VRAFLRGRKAEKSRILTNARGVNAAIPTLPENAISDEPHVAAIPPSLPQAPPLVTVKAAGRGSFMGDRRLARGRVCVVDTSLKSDPQQGLLTLPSAELAVTEVGVGASAVVDIRARRGLKLVAPTLHPAPLVPAHRTPRAVALVTSPSHARHSDRERGLLLGPARLAAMRALPDVPPPPDGAPLLALALELGALDAEARCPDHSGLEPGPALRQADLSIHGGRVVWAASLPHRPFEPYTAGPPPGGFDPRLAPFMDSERVPPGPSRARTAAGEGIAGPASAPDGPIQGGAARLGDVSVSVSVGEREWPGTVSDRAAGPAHLEELLQGLQERGPRADADKRADPGEATPSRFLWEPDPPVTNPDYAPSVEEPADAQAGPQCASGQSDRFADPDPGVPSRDQDVHEKADLINLTADDAACCRADPGPDPEPGLSPTRDSAAALAMATGQLQLPSPVSEMPRAFAGGHAANPNTWKALRLEADQPQTQSQTLKREVGAPGGFARLLGLSVPPRPELVYHARGALPPSHLPSASDTAREAELHAALTCRVLRSCVERPAAPSPQVLISLRNPTVSAPIGVGIGDAAVTPALSASYVGSGQPTSSFPRPGGAYSNNINNSPSVFSRILASNGSARLPSYSRPLPPIATERSGRAGPLRIPSNHNQEPADRKHRPSMGRNCRPSSGRPRSWETSRAASRNLSGTASRSLLHLDSDTPCRASLPSLRALALSRLSENLSAGASAHTKATAAAAMPWKGYPSPPSIKYQLNMGSQVSTRVGLPLAGSGFGSGLSGSHALSLTDRAGEMHLFSGCGPSLMPSPSLRRLFDGGVGRSAVRHVLVPPALANALERCPAQSISIVSPSLHRGAAEPTTQQQLPESTKVQYCVVENADAVL